FEELEEAAEESVERPAPAVPAREGAE
ncbi:MAG: hypothetical protein JWL78_1444, partial [Chloroflexi bacterium]|nr:hypothetical protein [Chloroflexota bacterium]